MHAKPRDPSDLSSRKVYDCLSVFLLVRVSGYGGWFLLRLSLHDPVLPFNIEAPSYEDTVKLGLAVLAAVKEFPALDTSALDKFVHVLSPRALHSSCLSAPYCVPTLPLGCSFGQFLVGWACQVLQRF
ncbi:hypothetical protein NE237_003658 [Protea cynaroides]|uniref:Uncharacterized protein n=1 Tax=Protea cynaroides TaxID=273540 RepID=A0A9Q0QSY1_9MAGN|nr:hypothetical protein NE237_003658 [Protea cynaroides]